MYVHFYILYVGDEAQDWDTQLAVKDLLSVIKKFPEHFNESIMFNGGVEANKLKYEFKQHFRNITRIMDCVGCDKCKLWGKLQVRKIYILVIIKMKRSDQPARERSSRLVRFSRHCKD